MTHITTLHVLLKGAGYILNVVTPVDVPPVQKMALYTTDPYSWGKWSMAKEDDEGRGDTRAYGQDGMIHTKPV